MELVAGLFVWGLCGILAGAIASSRGAGGCFGAILGFLLGPIGVIIACVLPSNRAVPVVIQNAGPAVPPSVESGNQQTCPHCRSYIPAAATVCRYCQRDIPAPVPYIDRVLPPNQNA